MNNFPPRNGIEKSTEKEILADDKVLAKMGRELCKGRKPADKALQKLQKSIGKYEKDAKGKGRLEKAKGRQAEALKAAKKYAEVITKMAATDKGKEPRTRLAQNMRAIGALEIERVDGLQMFVRVFAKTSVNHLEKMQTEIEKIFDNADTIKVHEDLLQFCDRCLTLAGPAPAIYFAPPAYDLPVPIEDLAKSELVRRFEARRFFGVSLEETLENEESTAGAEAVRLPKVFTALVDAVIKMGGLETKGIFRISATTAAREALEAKLEQGNLNIEGSDPHVPAGVLKKFLRDLSEPLVPETQYRNCVNLGQLSPKDENISPSAAAVWDQVPPLHKLVLTRVCELMVQVAEKEEGNQMGLSNLGVVFGPGCIRPPQVEDDAQAMAYVLQYYSTSTHIKAFTSNYLGEEEEGQEEEEEGQEEEEEGQEEEDEGQEEEDERQEEEEEGQEEEEERQEEEEEGQEEVEEGKKKRKRGKKKSKRGKKKRTRGKKKRTRGKKKRKRGKKKRTRGKKKRKRGKKKRKRGKKKRTRGKKKRKRGKKKRARGKKKRKRGKKKRKKGKKKRQEEEEEGQEEEDERQEEEEEGQEEEEEGQEEEEEGQEEEEEGQEEEDEGQEEGSGALSCLVVWLWTHMKAYNGKLP
eukprot:g51545.t1